MTFDTLNDYLNNCPIENAVLHHACIGDKDEVDLYLKCYKNLLVHYDAQPIGVLTSELNHAVYKHFKGFVYELMGGKK